MATLRLEFPVWIQYKDRQYITRPLFMLEPSISNERYDKAIKGLTKTIRKHFNQYKAKRQNINEVLWFLFNPDFQFEALHLTFEYGSRFFNNKISVAWFKQKGYTFVCLPAFNNYFFITENKNPKKHEISDEVIKHIQTIARKHKKEEDTDFYLDNYVAQKGEFCTTLDMHLYVVGEKINLGHEQPEFFQQFFRQDSNFEGRYEITKVGYEMNELFPNELSRAFFYDTWVEQLKRMLYNRENIPIVILGSRKVGKTTLLEETVYRYLEEQEEDNFHRLDNVWHIDPSRVIAGMSVVGMWQRRMEAIIQYVLHPLNDFPRQDKLYFTNIVALFRIGKSAQNSMTLSDVLKPYMQERRLQLILEATPEEWDVVSELDRGFVDLFKVVRLNEPDEETSLKIINRVRVYLEHTRNFMINNFALLRLIELQRRFNLNEVLIGAISESLQQLSIKYINREVSVTNVIAEFSAKTHLNARVGNTDITIYDNEFRDYIAHRLIGQEDAINCLVDVLHSIKAQLNNPEKPFGSFLFIGPTGVGKTQAAKVLANYLFTHEDNLVRFDMNEYIDFDAVNRLVGDLNNPEGQLTSKIRYNPYCILLFDEIEKAHPDVHNLFLQVLGEGRLTDSLGRTISFCNTIIIMTSNLGAERVNREINIQRRDDLAQSTYEKAVKDFFKPEFVNRIDKVVIFNKLTSKDIAKIAWLQIKDLLNRHGFLRRHTILNVSQEVLELIAEKGFDPEMGGRALKRQIEKQLTVLIAEQLVTMPPDNPVIFNLYLDGQQLKPYLVHLKHVEALPSSAIPNISNLNVDVSNFKILLEEVESLKEEFISEGLVQENLDDTTLVELKDKLFEIETELKHTIYDYEIGQNTDISSISSRGFVANNAKVIRHIDAGSKMSKVHLRDLYSQLEISDYLDEVASAANKITNEANSTFFDLFQDLSWIKLGYKSYQDTGIEHVVINIRSKIENIGFDEVEYLENFYNRIYSYEEIEFPTKYANNSYLYFKGVGLERLFKQEEGYHMFFTPHESPLPVEVKIYKMSEKDDFKDFIKQVQKPKWDDIIKHNISKSTEDIIRLYNINTNDSWQKIALITDLRTGLIHKDPLDSEDETQSYISDKDLKLMFYANFPEDYKLEVF